MATKIIGLKELRQNTEVYIKAIEQKGDSFVVVRRSKPIFKISPSTDEDHWETVIDFTKIKKGGVEISELLSRL